MRSVRKHADPGRVDPRRVRSTDDEEIARQIAADPDLAPEADAAAGWRRVYAPPVPDVQAIRAHLGLSQSAFAARFGLSVRTVQQWEQGRAVPDRPARVLLSVIAASPRTVAAVVSARAGGPGPHTRFASPAAPAQDARRDPP